MTWNILLLSVVFVSFSKSEFTDTHSNFLACMFCFPNSDHVMFSREFGFCLFINNLCIDIHVDASV